MKHFQTYFPPRFENEESVFSNRPHIHNLHSLLPFRTPPFSKGHRTLIMGPEKDVGNTATTEAWIELCRYFLDILYILKYSRYTLRFGS
jgi:hypothetical protein